LPSNIPADTRRIKVSGIQEILLIVLVVVGLFFLPRLVNRRSEPEPARVRSAKKLGGAVRLALLASGLWAAVACLWLRPWQGDVLPFVLLGLGPVAVGWGLVWVALGFRKRG
jgi:hypothetical protein